MAAMERDLKAAQRRLREVQRRTTKMGDGVTGLAAQLRKQTNPNVLGVLEDKTLLRMFSFLQARDVISVAQVCKPFFKRVDSIFGIGSRVAREYNSAPNGTHASSRSGAIGDRSVEKQLESPEFTAAMAAALAGKLTSPEMKAILSFKDRIRRQEGQIAELKAQKEDLAARLQVTSPLQIRPPVLWILQSTERVKDFLVDKMRDTETALRLSIEETQALGRQKTSDSDVITFLDLRVQELERLSEELTHSQGLLRQTLEFEKANSAQKIHKLTAAFEQAKAERDNIEAQWKGQKKLLVKEVKTLRQALSQVQVERDQLKQNVESVHMALAALRPLTR
jgi:hypothetical protein